MTTPVSALATLSAICAAAILPLGGAEFSALTHHWNFDEGPDWHDDPFQSISTATTVHDHVGTSDATLTGMTGSSFVSGVQYSGLIFDGIDDSLLSTADLSPALGGTASLSYWIMTSQSGTALADSSPGLLGSTGVQWGWIDDEGKVALSVDGTALVRSANPVNDGRWHHIVLTRDVSSGEGQVFVDGLLSSTAIGATGFRAGTITRFGHLQNGSTAMYAGRLDQIHVFNGVVDAATIAALLDNHAPKTWSVSCDGEKTGVFNTGSILVSDAVYDAEQDTISLVSFTQPTNGTVSSNGDGTFSYTPAGSFTGTDPFEVTLADGQGGFTTNTVNVKVTGPASPDSNKRTVAFTDFGTVSAGGSNISHSGLRAPRGLDWDHDGDQDLLVGGSGGIWLYQNAGTPAVASFATGLRVKSGGFNISLSGSHLITLADMTGDGVDDLVVVDSSRKVRIYPNTSAAGQEPVYGLAVIVPSSAGGDFVLPNQRFDVGDWDGDGLLDVLVGNFSGEVRVYRNVGTATTAELDPSDYQVIESGSYNLYPRFFDINRNGTMDYIRAINWGSINYWTDIDTSVGLSSANGSGALVITDDLGATVDIKPFTDGALVDFVDFNNDGVLDVVMGGHAGSNIHLATGVANTVSQSIAAIEAIYDAHPTGLGAALEANSQTLLNQLRGAESNIIFHMNSAPLSERQSMFNQMVTHVGTYSFLQMGTPVDTVEYKHIPSIAGQNLMTMHKMLPDSAAHRISVANAVGLVGAHRDIYLQMGLHVGDNQKATQGQIESVRDFMRLQPRESFPDSMITLDHYYGDGRGGHVNSFRGAKNTFNFGEGNNSTEWASDLNAAAVAFYGSEVQRGDYFTFVMGHEVTHSLDGYVASRANKDLFRRRGQMLTLAAGPDVVDASGTNLEFYNLAATKARFQSEGHWNGVEADWSTAWADYWTSGPGSAFESLSFMRGNIDWFLGAAQESMATQANHHWAHAEARLIGAIDRYNRGVAQGIEPMKANATEVTTFLDWISCGMNKVIMQDTTGVSSPYPHADYNTTHAWLTRDDNGYVTKVKTAGRIYEFEVDATGIVRNLLEAPVFQKPDSATVVQNTQHIIRPLLNDETNGHAPSIESFTQPSHGTVVDHGGGVLIYSPNPGYLGPDSFTYLSSSGVPPATISIIVKAPASSVSGVTMETWNGITGTSVSNMTSDPDFPNVPDTSAVRPSFAAPSNRGSNFGTRMLALIIPPSTGDYIFWIASDDDSQLFLSSDRSAASMSQIASVSGYTGATEWTKFPSQQSPVQSLVAGQPYYIEVRHKEGSGGDNLAVAWQGPDILQGIIEGQYLKTIDLHAPTLATPIADVTVAEDSADTVLDLSSHFSDIDLADTLTLEVHLNSNPSIVTTSFAGMQLTLSYASGTSGMAEISIRAVDGGGSMILDTFNLTLEPALTALEAWRLANFGTIDSTGDAANDADPDGDSVRNADEFRAGTDPRDPDSRLHISAMATSGSDLVLDFPSISGKTYQVEWSDSLQPGSWSIVETNSSPQTSIPGTDGIIQITDTNGANQPRRFYRVSLE